MKLTEVRISAFRGLQNVHLGQLGDLNIITGDNSSGKTAILEAVYMILGLKPETIAGFPTKFRRQQGNIHDGFWDWLYPDKNLKNQIEVQLTASDGNNYGVRADLNHDRQFQFLLNNNGAGRLSPQNASFPNRWPTVIAPSLDEINYSKDAEKYSAIAMTKGGEERILALMQTLDPRVTKVRYLKSGQNSLVYLDIGLSNLIPISQMGEAFSRVFSLYLDLLSTDSTVVILDEIENGIHGSKMDIVWRGLAALARDLHKQIIATTHSRECLRAAFEAVLDDEVTSTRHYQLELQGVRVNVKASDSFLSDGS